jgi:uncharacterized repeat protein (TIGR03943 family)
VRRRFQWLILIALGTMVLRTATTDAHLRYVQPFMRPVLIITGAALLYLGLADALRTLHQRDRQQPVVADHDHGVDGAEHPSAPRSAWLLLLPVVCVVALAPSALGAYSAERAAEVTLVDPGSQTDSGFEALAPGPVVPLTLTDYSSRAYWDTAASLEGRTLRLTGFVTTRPEGGWYLTRMSLQCCAADAAAIRVAVLGAPAPPVDRWVEVEGTWLPDPVRPGTDEATGVAPARISAARVKSVPTPRVPYE